MNKNFSPYLDTHKTMLVIFRQNVVSNLVASEVIIRRILQILSKGVIYLFRHEIYGEGRGRKKKGNLKVIIINIFFLSSFGKLLFTFINRHQKGLLLKYSIDNSIS